MGLSNERTGGGGRNGDYTRVRVRTGPEVCAVRGRDLSLGQSRDRAWVKAGLGTDQGRGLSQESGQGRGPESDWYSGQGLGWGLNGIRGRD